MRPPRQPPGMRRPGAAYTNATSRICARMILAIIAIGYVLINFAIDALYVVLDPRIRRARA